MTPTVTTQAEDPDGNITVTGYDGDGRATSVTQPSYTPPGASSPITATTSYAYDGDGNLVQVTDPAGNVTKYTYDALGDLTAQTDPQLPGRYGPGVWTYTYDAAGELPPRKSTGTTSGGSTDGGSPALVSRSQVWRSRRAAIESLPASRARTGPARPS